jgi:hypothetical protein
MYDDINETTNARSFMSFHLNFMLLMIRCNRTEEAERSLAHVLDAIDQLPEDLNITINQEINNA